jgi:UDP-N-acetylmuramyl pentapeptide phosphotransferase/UDP-N-acetylglucosamine-1-phosphate transferase
LTKLCIKLLPAIGLVDEPVGGRHIHRNTVPKGGGLAIIGAFFITWLCFLFSDWSYFLGNLKLGMLQKIGLLSCLIIILGIFDDKCALKAKVKLLSQIFISVICWTCGIKLNSIFGFALPDATSLILTVLWITGFVNAFNLIDGMDGLATGLGVISAICMATVFAVSHAPNDTVVILCLAACCLGFLFYNFHPAKIFLGDTGSMFLGFIFAVIGIVSSNKSAAVTSILIPMLAAGVPILDVVLAIWRRFTRNLINHDRKNAAVSISEADKEHLHHRLWEKEHRNQRTATLKLYFMSVAFALVAILNLMKRDMLVGLSYILVLLLIYTLVRRIAHIELWNTGKAILTGFNLPRKSIIVTVMQPFFDIASIVIIYLFCRFLFIDSIYNENLQLTWYARIIYTAAPIVLALNLGGSYKRNWLQGSAPDYIYFIKCLLTGFLLLILFDLSGGINGWRSFVAERLLFFALTSLALLGERLFLRYLKHHLINIFFIEKSHGIVLQKILVYGAGPVCRHFIARQGRILEEHPNKIIGIIDDDPMFQGQYVFGLKVLGRTVDIKKIYHKIKFDKITITMTIDNSTKNTLVDFCKTNKITLTEWKGEELVILDFLPVLSHDAITGLVRIHDTEDSSNKSRVGNSFAQFS